MFAESHVWKESDGLHRLFPYTPLTVRAKGDGALGANPRSFPGFAGPIPFANYHAHRVINPPADAKTLDLTLTDPRGLSREMIATCNDGKYLARTLVGADDPTPITIRLEPAGSALPSRRPD